MKKKLINRWGILGAFGVASILLLLSLLFGFGFVTPSPDSAGLQLADLTVIPGPTSTPRFVYTPTHDPALGTATPLPGTMAIGNYVQIGGTDGDGLRLRADAGLGGEPLFLGYEAEVFLIKDGAVEADGYSWWYLVAPYDETRTGWAASAFLEAIPSP